MAAVDNFAVLLLVVAFVNCAQSGSLSCSAKRKDGLICPRSKNIEIKYKPYYDMYFKRDATGLYPLLLSVASSQCCNESVVNFIALEDIGKGIEELVENEKCEKEAKNDTKLTFFFPVYTKENKKVVFEEEFTFVPLMKSPGPALLMLSSEKDKMKVSAAVAIRESWPLFILIVSLSATVGLLNWFMDHSSNPSQFSAWFYKGSWEGFWWAMVTITTVGYGDKVPTTFFSRTLAILWMFCGAIIFSLFTANVTSVLTSNQIDDSRKLIGLKIGVLNSKHYFESNLNVGATIVEYNSQDELFNKIKERKVDRILTPNYLDILELLEDGDFMKNLLSIVNVFNEPFNMGLALVNKGTKEDRQFISCLKRQSTRLKSDMVSTKLDGTTSTEEVSGARTTMLFHTDIIKIIYYNLIAIGSIGGLGILLDILKFLKRKSEKKSNTIEETEMRRLDSA